MAAEATPPVELAKIRAAFASAVAANDEKGTAALTSFPLKTTVYRQPPVLARAAFGKLFADYRDMAACIKTAPLENDKVDWPVDCNGNILHFGLSNGRWRHTAYENVNE